MVTDQKFPKGIEVVSTALITNEKGEILLTKSPNKWKKKWTLPGGHVDPGETIVVAALREGKEETGLELEPLKVLRWGEMILSEQFHRPAHFIYFHVLCKITGGELKVDTTELSEYQWLPAEEALKVDLAEGFEVTIQKYIDYLTHKSI